MHNLFLATVFTAMVVVPMFVTMSVFEKKNLL
jgi:hypothetical protein